MTEVLTSLFAPLMVMLILVMFGERFIYMCVLAADFVTRLITDPSYEPRRPVSR
jgi:hypothetical protein